MPENRCYYVADSVARTFHFTVQVTDTTAPTPETASQALTITVGPALSITTAALPTATVGSVYSQSLAATGGTPTYTWAMAVRRLTSRLNPRVQRHYIRHAHRRGLVKLCRPRNRHHQPHRPNCESSPRNQRSRDLDNHYRHAS